MNYQIWYRKLHDRRAPSIVDLTDYSAYKFVGELEAANPSDLLRKVQTLEPDEHVLADHRNPDVGDVIVDEAGTASILTPVGLWSIVEVIEDEDNEIVDTET